MQVRACIDTSPIDRYQAAEGPVEALDLEVPLESKVERLDYFVAQPFRAAGERHRSAAF